MVNAPKAKGTLAETAIVKLSKTLGYEQAQRLPLVGTNDMGDVRISPTLIAQSKSGRAAEMSSFNLRHKWWCESLKQADAYRTMFGQAVHIILVTKVKGIGPANAGDWAAHFAPDMKDQPLITMRLVDFLVVYRDNEEYRDRLLGRRNL